MSAAAHVVWRPLAGGLALLALTAAGVLYALAGAPGARVVPLALAAAQVALVALAFMRLRAAEGLVRLAAVAGIGWAFLLFLLTFADLLTR